MLDRSSPLPLHAQIKVHILSMLGDWVGPSKRFHTEHELCRMFGVSRMTVRQAIDDLVQDGWLTRRRGAGTFVVPRKVEERLTPRMRVSEGWPGDDGREMQIEPIAFEMRPCPSDIAAALDLGEGAPVRYVARLRLADGVPIAIDQRYVPGSVAAGVRRSGAMRSILHTLWDQHELSHGELELEASSAGPDEARWLRIAEGTPIMLRRLRYLTREGMPILAGRSCYRADLVRYSIHVPLSREFRSTLEPFARSEEAPRAVRLRREIAPR